MAKIVEIVDRGRGPQLSTSRVTVQDLVPYLQRGMTCGQILDIMPVLSREEVLVVEEYVRANFDAVMQQDRRIRERNANRKNTPQIEAILQRGGEKMAALRAEFEKKKHAETSGAPGDSFCREIRRW